MMSKTFLLTDEFPPIVTGISRLMGEIAHRYPTGELLVSTGQHRDAQASMAGPSAVSVQFATTQ